MTIRELIAERLSRWLFWLAGAAAAGLFLLLTGSQSGVLVILLIAWCLVSAVGQAVEFLRLRAHLEELESILDALDQKHLFAECVPRPKSAYEQKLFALMRRSGKAMIESVSQAEASQREYRQYIESWVHEIKTPITAARLLCQGAAPELRRKLTCELAQIDNHVERALFYARAESPEKDFIIRQVKLEELVTEAIEHHRSLLLQSGVRIALENLDCCVYTDGKWAVFLLGQLLQNAVRYKGEAPVITLGARCLGRQVQLTVGDNGIGVPDCELPRIFERGFTGSNGRARGGATGMGLYLCKRLAGFLELGLLVKSEEGQGTSVVITFPAKETLSKL